MGKQSDRTGPPPIAAEESVAVRPAQGEVVDQAPDGTAGPPVGGEAGAAVPGADAQRAGAEETPAPERPLDRRLRQRHPWRELPAIVVLVIAAAGLGYVLVIPQHWLRGVLLFAGAMGLGGALRLLLPSRYAGLLSIRNRWFDSFCFIALAAAMAALGLWLRSIGAT